MVLKCITLKEKIGKWIRDIPQLRFHIKVVCINF